MSHEHLAKIEATDGYSRMTYTTAQGGRTPAQLAVEAAHNWEDQHEVRYSDMERLRLTAKGFNITVTVDGQPFTVSMYPSLRWTVHAEPMP